MSEIIAKQSTFRNFCFVIIFVIDSEILSALLRQFSRHGENSENVLLAVERGKVMSASRSAFEYTD